MARTKLPARKKVPPQSILNALPRHLFNAHVAPKLSNANMVQWSMTRRSVMQGAQPELARRRISKEAELRELASLVASALKRAMTDPQGAAAVQRALNSSAYQVSTHVQSIPGWQMVTSLTSTIRSPRFDTTVIFTQAQVAAMATVHSTAIFTITSRGQGRGRVRVLVFPAHTPAVQPTNFPPELTRVVESAVGLRRSPRRLARRGD